MKGPVVESTNERAFLQAHLEIARMRGKMHGTSARERVDAVKERWVAGCGSEVPLPCRLLTRAAPVTTT